METRSHHPPVHASMQSQSLPHSTRHSEPRKHPRSPQSVQDNLGAATPSTPRKGQRTLKPIPTNQKPDKRWVSTRNLSARLLTSGNQSPRTLTFPPPPPPWPGQAVQPLPGHPNAYPKCPQGYHRICPVQAPPNQHTGKKTTENEGISSL